MMTYSRLNNVQEAPICTCGYWL